MLPVLCADFQKKWPLLPELALASDGREGPIQPDVGVYLAEGLSQGAIPQQLESGAHGDLQVVLLLLPVTEANSWIVKPTLYQISTPILQVV